MLRLDTTLDQVITFLSPAGQALPRVTLARTSDAVHGTDLRELTRDEWPLIAVRGLSGRVGEQVSVIFDASRSPLPLPAREEMAVIMLRWKAPPIEEEARPAGEHHITRQARKTAGSKFEQRVRQLQKKPGS